jgi:hypothetical protein
MISLFKFTTDTMSLGKQLIIVRAIDKLGIFNRNRILGCIFIIGFYTADFPLRQKCRLVNHCFHTTNWFGVFQKYHRK